MGQSSLLALLEVAEAETAKRKRKTEETDPSNDVPSVLTYPSKRAELAPAAVAQCTDPATSNAPEMSAAPASGPRGQPLILPTSTTTALPQTRPGHSVIKSSSDVGVQIQGGQSSRGQISMDHAGIARSLLNNPEFARACAEYIPSSGKEFVAMNGNSLNGKLMAEATVFMDQMKFLSAQCKKALATITAQAKDLEILNSTCNKQRNEIDSLKNLVVDKDKTILIRERWCRELRKAVNELRISLEKTKEERDVRVAKAESRVAKTEQQAQIAWEKITELENKLKVKEEEEAQVSKKFGEVTISLNDTMNMIQEMTISLRGVDFCSLEMPKEQNDVQNSALQLTALERKKAEENLMNLAEDQKQLRGSMSVIRYMGDMGDEIDIEVLRKMKAVLKELRKKEEKLEGLEVKNETLTLRYIRIKAELLEAREKMITGLEEISSFAPIGVERMGELDSKPFLEAMERRYNEELVEERALELYTQWEEYLKDPGWCPFKSIKLEGKYQVKVDEEDEKLKNLRNEWGEEVYVAVTNVLLEMFEYNPYSGRCSVPKLWNFKKGRKASLKEAIECLIEEHKTLCEQS
ncbi:hypothetical protein PTKIN_Ptkin13bG0178700 [Pterospermum kingtungense]